MNDALALSDFVSQSGLLGSVASSIAAVPPGMIMVAGGLLLALVPAKQQARAAVGLSVLSLIAFLCVPNGSYGNVTWFGETLNLVRIDSLSRIFGLIFHLAAIIGAIYALHVEDWRQHIASLVYAGGAIAACCAGDLVTLFVFWELTAISSVFLVWASDNERSGRAGMRYLIIQVGSGVLLLSGAIVQYVQTSSLAFERFTPADGQPLGLGPLLILLAFGIKCAFPLMHNWLQDSYPKATITGTVFLSAFTTKLAVYSLARGFAGLDMLIPIGCAMTLFPIVFAVIENDLRRVLAYSLNNQLGFMVVGIGIGTPLAINGTAAHAFCHIIYKALLFMSMGAVMYRVGTCKATELGGLHKSMPWTAGFCAIGAGAISGFPLLSGFVSKSMIITAAGEQHLFWVWIVLLIASAGVMEHSGIKIPFFAFFAHDSGKRPDEAPRHMLVAMGMAAFLCVGLGIGYPLLYWLLPNQEVEYHPYTMAHVFTQLQLLLFAALAFVVLMKLKLYPPEIPSENLDTDWFYRRPLPALMGFIRRGISAADRSMRSGMLALLQIITGKADDLFSERGLLGRTWSSSTMALWATILLGVCLLIYYS